MFLPLSALTDDALVPLPMARRDYFGNVSDMTIWRWRRDASVGFPPVVQIRRRNYISGRNLKEFVARLNRRAA